MQPFFYAVEITLPVYIHAYKRVVNIRFLLNLRHIWYFNSGVIISQQTFQTYNLMDYATNMNKFNRNIGNHFLLIMLLILASCSDQGNSEQALLQKARSYLDNRDLMEASIELRNTLLSNAQNAEARYLLAGINLEIGDLEAAEKEYRRAADAGWKADEIEIGTAKVLMAQYKFRQLIDDIKIKDSWPLTSRANLLGIYAAAEASIGDIDQAKSTLATGTELQADAFQIIKTTAIFQLVSGEIQEAVNTLSKGLAIYQNNTELLLLTAVAEQRQEDFSKAAETYRNIISQGPTNVITVHNRQARIALARLAILQKNYDEAQSTLNPLLERNKSDPDANFLGGLLAFDRKDYKLADERISKLLEIAPEHAPSLLLMGKIKYARENYDQASLHLNNYLNKSPDDVVATRLLVSSYIALNKTGLAKSTLEPVLDKNPNDKGLLSLMSQLQLVKGDTQAGIKELQKSVDASPDDADTHKQLAQAYIVAGETDKAIDELKTYQRLSKKTEEANNLMILAYLGAGKFNQAINIAQDMLAAAPLDTDILSLNGSLYVSSDNNVEARKYYNKALQIDKDFTTAHIGLARIEGIEGNTDKAIKIYKDLAAANKGGNIPVMALAEIAKQQNRTEDMLRWLEKARQAAPDEVNPRIALANYYFQSKQLEKADLLTLEALKIDPANKYLLALHGRILIGLQRYNKALTPLKALVEKDPKSAPARVLLGETYMRLGIDGNARTHLGKALQIQPANVSALALMAEMELHAGAADNSLPYAKKLQQAQPEFYVGYSLEGDAWTAMQNNTRAKTAYLSAWNKQQTGELSIKLYKAADPSESFDDAIAYMISWLSAHPEDNKTRKYLAGTYQENQENDNAVMEYELVIKNSPDDVATLNNLAWLYSLKGDPRALQLAESAYNKTSGKNPYIRDTYGWILVQQGQHKKAVTLLNQAVNQVPDNLVFQYHYAVATLKAGKETEGLRLLEKLVNKNQPFDGREDAQKMIKAHKK